MPELKDYTLDTILAEDSAIQSRVLPPETADEPTLALPDPAVPKQRKKHRFFKGLCVYFVLMLAAIAVLLWFLYNHLVQYEAATPNAALRSYLTWVETGNYEALYESSGFEETTLNDKAAYLAYVEDLYGDADNLEVREQSSGDDAVRRYTLYSNDTRLSTVVLARSTEGNGDTWYATTELVYKEAFTVTASDDVRLQVNGIDLHLLSLPSTDISDTLYPQDEDSTLTLPTIRTYTLEGLLGEPEITALTLNGDSCTVLRDGQEFCVLYPTTEAEQQADEDFAVQAATSYAKFVAKDAERSEILSLIHKESPLYDTVRTYSNTWFGEHQSYEFLDTAVTEYRQYSATDFSCVVSFRPIYYRNGKRIENPTLHYQMSFVRTEDGCVLYSLQQQAAEDTTTDGTTDSTSTTTAS